MRNRSVLFWAVLAIVACAGLYLVGNSRVPLWDRDEPWYAQCSWKMILDNDYVVPRYLDGRLRHEKPPLIYWLQSVPMRMFGPGEFGPRLVSSVAMMGVLVLVAAMYWRLAGPRRAAWTAFILGSSALTIALAKMCLTDAMLLLCTTTIQFCLLMFYRGRGAPWLVLVMAAAAGLGFYDKGPIVFMAPATTLLMLGVLDFRRWTAFVVARPRDAWHRTVYGLFAVLIVLGAITAMLGPWAWLISQRAPEWIPGILNTAKGHVAKTMDGHGGWPGWYAAVIWATYFPWSLLLPTTAIIAFRHRKIPEIRFAIAAVLGPWLCHELAISTKLPHYMLPAFPFLAFLTADALVRCIRRQHLDLETKLFRRATFVWALLLGVLPSAVWLLALRKLPVWQGIDLGPMPWAAMVAVSLAGLAMTWGVWWLFHKQRIAEAAGWMGGGFLLLIAVIYGWYLPSTQYLAVSKNVASLLHEVKALASDGAPRAVLRPDGRLQYVVACLSYEVPYKARSGEVKYRSSTWPEPSMDFYQGGTLSHPREDRYLERRAPQYWPRVMIITPEIWNLTPPEDQAYLRIVGKVTGLTYNKKPGPVEVWVVENTAFPTEGLRPVPAGDPTLHVDDSGVTRPD